MVNPPVKTQNIDHNASHCDPRQEMRQIDQRLNALLESDVSNLAEQYRHNNRHDNPDHNFDDGYN
ncbi:hypothetical protein D3C74_437390 [compost metagenome]